MKKGSLSTLKLGSMIFDPLQIVFQKKENLLFLLYLMVLRGLSASDKAKFFIYIFTENSYLHHSGIVLFAFANGSNVQFLQSL